jgi:Asp-tRNA(Asn)/Glu-tRNA(Gln) amidotransferase A subunit family amidase
MTLSFEDYRRRDAVGLADLVRRREVSAAEVTEAAIARAEAVDPLINAVVERLYDEARAAAAAGPEGLLGGVPFAIKDLGHPIKGVRLTGGSRAFSDHVGAEDAESVRRYRAAGLVIFCTTATPEFGLTTTTESRLHGPTRNPWSLSHSAGGSSGGAAALVASGALPAAHATDGGGSIRVPAAACGLVGLKVSRGRCPVGEGRTEGWNGLGVSHAVTRSVRDCAALLDAAAGPETGARYVAPPPETTFRDALSRPPPRLRIALWGRAPNGAPVHKDCAEALADVGRLCQDLGHEVEEAGPEVDGAGLAAAMGLVVATHTAATLDERARVLGRPITPLDVEESTFALYQMGRAAPAVDLVAADLAFMRAAMVVAAFQERYDVILTPTLAEPPAALGRIVLDQPLEAFAAAIGGYSPFTALQNQTGQPAVSLPLFWSDERLPIGVQFVGRLGAEELLLSLAAELEFARPWFLRTPPILGRVRGA